MVIYTPMSRLASVYTDTHSRSIVLPGRKPHLTRANVEHSNHILQEDIAQDIHSRPRLHTRQASIRIGIGTRRQQHVLAADIEVRAVNSDRKGRCCGIAVVLVVTYFRVPDRRWVEEGVYIVCDRLGKETQSSAAVHDGREDGIGVLVHCLLAVIGLFLAGEEETVGIDGVIAV